MLLIQEPAFWKVFIFIEWRLNHWCHMDYFNDVLTTTLLNVIVPFLTMQGQRPLGFHQKYLNFSSEDKRRTYGFGMTWRRVINDRIFIFRLRCIIKDMLILSEIHICKCIGPVCSCMYNLLTQRCERKSEENGREAVHVEKMSVNVWWKPFSN